MKDALRQQFDRLGYRLTELDTILADGSVAADMKRYRALTREQAEVSSLVERYRRYLQREQDLLAARELLDSGDADLVDMAREEIASAQADLAQLDQELQLALIPKDPDDERPAASSKSAPAPAATNRRSSPATCSACTPATRKAAAGAARCCRPTNRTWAATRK